MHWTKSKLFSLLCLAVGLGFDAIGGAKLVYPESLSAENFQFLIWHSAGVLMGCLGLFGLASESYRRNKITSLLFFLGIQIPLPILGLLICAGWMWMISLPTNEKEEKKFRIGTKWFTEKDYTTMKHRPLVHEFSILEILGGMNPDARRNAILALRNLDPRKAIPVLQKAVQDSDEQVRILAQTQFNRITGMLEKRIKTFETKIESGHTRTDLLIQLAEQYHELVYLGLSTQETVAIHLARALELLGKAHEQDPDDISVLLLQLRCQLRLKNLNEAEATLKALRQNHSDPEITLPWEAEFFFMKKQWRELVELLSQLQDSHTASRTVHNLVDFWLNPIQGNHE